MVSKNVYLIGNILRYLKLIIDFSGHCYVFTRNETKTGTLPVITVKLFEYDMRANKLRGKSHW